MVHQIVKARRLAAHLGDVARSLHDTPHYATEKRNWLRAVDAMNALDKAAFDKRENTKPETK